MNALRRCCRWQLTSDVPAFLRPSVIDTQRRYLGQGSAILPSCIANVPSLEPLPSASFTVSGGTFLSLSIHEYLEEINANGTSLSAADYARLLSFLSKVTTSTVDKEPERHELICGLLHVLTSQEKLRVTPEFRELLMKSTVIGGIVTANNDALIVITEKVWSHVLENSLNIDPMTVNLAAHLLWSFKGPLPRAIVETLNDSRFAVVVRSLNVLEGWAINTNFALLAAMVRVRRPDLNVGILTQLCDNLSDQMLRLPLPSSNAAKMQLLDATRALQHCRYFHERFYLSYGLLVLEVIRSTDLTGNLVDLAPHGICRVLHTMSFASIPCSTLFAEVQRSLTPKVMEVLSTELLLWLVWAYIAQGLKPPPGSLAALDASVTKLRPMEVRANAEILEQVRPYLSESVDFVDTMLQKQLLIPKVFTDAEKLKSELQIGAKTDNCGTIPLCALVNTKHGNLIPWQRARVDATNLTADDVELLPGAPIAVLPCYRGQVYSPTARVTGPVLRKKLLLEQRGWHVLLFDMDQYWQFHKSAVAALLMRMKLMGTDGNPDEDPDI